MVGGMAGQQGQQDLGQEQHQSQQSKVERLMGDRVNLPADGDALHQLAGARRETNDQKETKISVTERRFRRDRLGGKVGTHKPQYPIVPRAAKKTLEPAGTYANHIVASGESRKHGNQ